MKQKFFIIGIYQGLNEPYECFRPTQDLFDSFQSCFDWIESHKKFFASSVFFGIYSVDNKF